MNLLKLFNSNEREIRKFYKVVEQINAFEPQIKQLNDEQLRGKTAEFKERLANGETLDDILPEAFAVVREAGVRTFGPNKARHYDVQMIGAMVLHQGRIAEMRTGEGKTLTATLPLYLNALEGKGAHLVTVNDYLSRRDARWYGPIYSFLGLTVGAIRGSDPETGEMGGSYTYDPEYVPEEEFSAEWPGLRPLHKEYGERAGRRMAYACDITYGTNHEFGFDYLRDNLSFSKDELVQRELNYAIVDEVDSILIDEARTPLIISGNPDEATDLYYKLDRVVARLYKDRDYTIDEKAKTAMLTEEGTSHVEEMLSITNLSDPENISLIQHVNAALKARAVYKKDIDYVVKDGQVIIVDEFTGRMMFGRRYGDGLHQALEAKENCEIQQETQTIASITYQNYFRLYNKLAGMTGTAKTEEEEFRKIYALDVVEIPTNKPMVRQDHADVFYKSEDAKFRGITEEILRLHAKGQPVLVGTRSIDVSERLSERLISERLQTLAATIIFRNKLEANKEVDGEKKKQYHQLLNSNFDQLTVPRLAGLARAVGVDTNMTSPENVQELAKHLGVDQSNIEQLQECLKEGIVHNVLNAKYHEREAEIISEAGAPCAVTIATNMAGRGVDILLGGAPENGQGVNVEAAELVRQRGGLHILGSERHESRRIDNQLRGRSGRQGDPGSSRFFVSLEDELWRLFGDKSKSFLLNSWQEDQAIDAGILSKMIERAQKKVEAYYFGIRKRTLEYDDVMNVQRELVYDQRRKILEGVDLKPTVASYLEQTITGAMTIYCAEGVHPSEWDTAGLFNHLNEIFPLEVYARPDDLNGKRREELEDFLVKVAEQTYTNKEQEIGEENMRMIERHLALDLINRKWMEHLANMDYLMEGIGLRGYAQQDPIVAYKKEGYDMFQEMTDSLQDDLVRWLYRVQIQQPPQQRVRARFKNVVESTGEAVEGDGKARQNTASADETRIKRKDTKVGRNDPCPCGSGKKYKKCCLAKDEA